MEATQRLLRDIAHLDLLSRDASSRAVTGSEQKREERRRQDARAFSEEPDFVHLGIAGAGGGASTYAQARERGGGAATVSAPTVTNFAPHNGRMDAGFGGGAVGITFAPGHFAYAPTYAEDQERRGRAATVSTPSVTNLAYAYERHGGGAGVSVSPLMRPRVSPDAHDYSAPSVRLLYVYNVHLSLLLYLHTHAHTHARTHAHKHVHTHTHTQRMYVCIYIYTHKHTHTHNLRVYIFKYIYICEYM